MLRLILAAGLFALLSLGTPAFAITAKEKRATCEFGAADQKLEGAKQKAFIARCMANEAPAKGKKKKEEKKK